MSKGFFFFGPKGRSSSIFWKAQVLGTKDWVICLRLLLHDLLKVWDPLEMVLKILSCAPVACAGEEAFIAKWAKTTQGRHRNIAFDVHCYHCGLSQTLNHSMIFFQTFCKMETLTFPYKSARCSFPATQDPRFRKPISWENLC